MGGVYTIVRGWKEGKGLAKEKIETLPIWVTLPNFPIHLWDTGILSSIGSVLGVPIRMDAHTARAPNSEGARILVKMEASGEFPKEISIFIKEDEGLIVEETIQFYYHKPPPKCFKCKKFGHWTNQCVSLLNLTGGENFRSSSEKGRREVEDDIVSHQDTSQDRPNKEKIGQNSEKFGKEGSSHLNKTGLEGSSHLDKPTTLEDLEFVGDGHVRMDEDKEGDPKNTLG